MKQKPFSFALRFALLYVLLSTGWILIPKQFIYSFLPSTDQHLAFEITADVILILISAGIFYVLLRRVFADRMRFAHELETHARQQEVISTLRQRALARSDPELMLNEAAMLVALTLDIEYSSVLELDSSGSQLVLRTGVGWQGDWFGKATVAAHTGTPPGYALHCTEPVVINEQQPDSRFLGHPAMPAYLEEHQIISSMYMVIVGNEQPFGVLGIHSDQARSFSAGERRFLRSVADVLATAMRQSRVDAELQLQKTRLECQSEASLDGILVIDPEGHIVSYNRRFADIWGFSSNFMQQSSVEALIRVGSQQVVDPEKFAQDIRATYEHINEPSRNEVVLSNGRIFDRYSAPIKDATDIYYGRVTYYRDITEMRQTQEALRAREEMLRTLVDSMDDIVFTLDLQQRHTGIFGRWVERYGLSADYFLGKTLRETAPSPELADIHEAANERALAGEPQVVYEWSIGDPPVFIQTSLSPMYNSQHTIIGLVGVGRDITRIKQAEEAYRLLVDHSLQGLILFQDQRIVFANDAMTTINGYSIEEMLTFSFEEINETVYPDDRAFIWDNLQRRLKGEPAPPRYECRTIRKDGSVRWVEASVVMFNYRGKPAIQVAYVDITERKQAEHALYRSAANFRTLAETNAAITMIFRDEQVLYVNAAAEAISGYSRHELLQQAPQDLIVPALRNGIQQQSDLLFSNTNGPLRYETCIMTRSGEERWIDVTASSIEFEGLPAGLVTAFDITARKEAAEELRRRNQQLSVLNLLTEAVSASLDMANILNTMTVLLQEHLNIAAGAIFLYHEKDNRLSVEATWGLPPSMRTRFEQLSLSQAHNASVVVTQTALLLSDLSSNTELDEILEGTDAQWSSYLGVPLVSHGETQGVLDLFGSAEHTFRSEQVTFMTIVGQQAGVAIQNARLFQEVVASRERLQFLSRRLVEVQEAERRTIARELHDEVGQILTGLNLSFDLIGRLPPEQMNERLEQARELVNELMLRIREMSLELRPPMLDDLGLVAALVWQFERYTTQTNVRVIFKHHGLERRFAPEVETAIYRVVQEALTNVARYASVSQVQVRLWANSEAIGVQIEDKGTGFDPEQALTRYVSSGLSGMRERARLLGGELIIESQPEAGSCLTIELPLK